MWTTAAFLPPADDEHAARLNAYRREARSAPAARPGEFLPLTAQSERDRLTHRIPSDEQRWERIDRVAPRRNMILHKTLVAGCVTVFHNGLRFPLQTLADVERRLFGGHSWDDRL